MAVKEKIRAIYGQRFKRFKLLGIPVIELRRTDNTHYNLYVFRILPVFRIIKDKQLFSIHILVFVWFSKVALRIKKKVEKRIIVHKYEKNLVAIQEKAKQGIKIKACLFVSRITCWQYANLYSLMESSGIFDPVVVVKPFMLQGEETMKRYMEQTYSILKEQGFRVIKGYDEETDSFLDVRKEIEPDIVVYSKFWKPMFHKYTYINRFLDIPTFLFDYGFNVAHHPLNESLNFEMQNMVTKYFLHTPIHSQMAKRLMDNCGSNVVVSGSPKFDAFFSSDYVPKDVWKEQNKRKKRIIWAPHHSDGFAAIYYQYNAFYEICDYMIDIANKYADQIQWAFRPHPMIKAKLEKRWGKDEADEYYDKWSNMENTQYEDGEFIDLFMTSDAMILDSISFIAEYTITNKPALFTIGKNTRVMLNEYGEKNFEVLYKTRRDFIKEDIQRFIEEVVLEGNDAKKTARETFIHEYLIPPNGKTGTENIYDGICETLNIPIRET